MHGVLFDARVLRPGMTGIGNYARSLLRALPAGRVRVGILLPAGSPHAADFPGCRVHFTRVGLTSHPWTELYEQVALPLFCRRHGYDRFVSFEGRVPLFHPGLKTYPFVYDLAYANVPGSHNLRYSLLLRVSQWIARRSATRILTISRTVRAQIAKAFPVPAERVSVIYPSDSGLEASDAVRPAGVRTPYFLAVSLTNPRKNLETLLKGFADFRAAGGAQQLVLTGNRDWIEREVRASGTPDVVNLGFASEGALRWLYENAQALIYPSRDEGFGIPLVDAARFGCPVACSDIPVFREVMGDSADYFDPSSPAALTAALQRAAGSGGRDDPSRLTHFSWEASARALIETLEEKTSST
jgi:glycosyltransferase involved in cell wall biosynthesis